MRRNLGTNLQGFFSSQEEMGFLGSHLPGILVRQYQYNILRLLASIYPACLCMDDLITVSRMPQRMYAYSSSLVYDVRMCI